MYWIGEWAWVVVVGSAYKDTSGPRARQKAQ
jgi:hypothetical protein